MSSLLDSCEVLGQNLVEANRQCKNMKDELDQFTAIVSTLPLAMVKLRLTTIACQIAAQAFTLRAKHDGKGFAYVMASRNARICPISDSLARTQVGDHVTQTTSRSSYVDEIVRSPP